MSKLESVRREPQFAAFVGIDWADQKHAWCLQAADSQKRESGELEHTPEAVEMWVGEHRIVAIRQAIPAIRDRAVIEAKSTVVKVIVQLVRSLVEGIADLDEKIGEAAAAHPDFFIFESLPGAGAVMAPRLLAAFGSQREWTDLGGDRIHF